MWKGISEKKFYVYTVVNGFNPTKKFSSVQLDVKKSAHVLLSSIIHFDYNSLVRESEDEAENKAVVMLLNVLSQRIKLTIRPPFKKSVMLEVVTNVLSKLGVSTSVENCHKSWLKDLEEEESLDFSFIDIEPLGIGSKREGKETWYGTPDSRVRGVSPRLSTSVTPIPSTSATPRPSTSAAHSCEVNIIGVEDIPLESDGCSSYVEFILRMKLVSQFISTSVVASFTEHHHHGDKNPLVPVIVINSRTIMIVLYDCVHDVLMLSESIDLFNEYTHSVLESEAILLMWIFVNHRSVLGVCVNVRVSYANLL